MSAVRNGRTQTKEEPSRTERELMSTHQIPLGIERVESVEVRRLPMKQVFTLMRLVKDSPLGDLINVSQGQLSGEALKRIVAVEDPDERRRVTEAELASLDTSATALMGLFVDAEATIYAILALALDRDVDWISENVGLADFVRVLAVVGRQELLDTDFFGAVRDVVGIWGRGAPAPATTPTTTMEKETIPTDGSGEPLAS